MHFYRFTHGHVGLSDSAYKNMSIHDGLTWSEIIPKKKSLINKNGGQGDLVIALSLLNLILKISNRSLLFKPQNHQPASLKGLKL